MNPGGDFGKRELSPALRSRFTEVSFDGLEVMTQAYVVFGVVGRCEPRRYMLDLRMGMIRCLLDSYTASFVIG